MTTPSLCQRWVLASITGLLLISILLASALAHDEGVAHPHDGVPTFPPNVQGMITQETQIALGISVLAAFLAGIISFTSPCGFVLVPAFFAVAFRDRKKSLAMAGMFSLGLMLAFVIFGVVAGLAGSFYNPYKTALAWWSGLAVAIFGIMTLLNIGLGALNLHMGAKKPAVSFMGMFTFGFLFAIGWTPCIGAILAGILLLAAVSGGLLKSAMLLFAFGAGVVIPLMIVAGLSDRYNLARRFQGRVWTFTVRSRTFNIHTYNLFGGLILIILGIAIMLAKGTRLIEIMVTDYTPWTMDYFVQANARLTALSFPGSDLAGFVMMVGVIAIIAWSLYTLSKSSGLYV